MQDDHARPHPGLVDKVIAWIRPDVAVVSVVLDVPGVGIVHRYRLVGGPDDGSEFDTLSAVCDYTRQRTTGYAPADQA
jgi:hypothetical protein